LRSISASFGKKYRAALGTPKPLPQQELSIDDAALPFFRDVSQTAHRTRLAESAILSHRVA
jgi:hypothetical protein